MKILLVNDFVEDIGGTEVYCHQLKVFLEKRGHEVKLIGGRWNSSNNRLRRFISSFFSIEYYYKIRGEILKFKPDILHANGVSVNISPSFLCVAKKHRIPVAMTVHNFSCCICPQGLMMYANEVPCELGFSIKCLAICLPKKTILFSAAKCLKLWLHRRLLKRYVDVFISPSKTLARWLEKSLNPNNILTIPHFIEFKNVKVKEVGDTKSIIYVGRLNKDKGLEYLIKAMPFVLRRGNDVSLHIVGEGEMKGKLKGLTRELGVEAHVIFHGYIPNVMLYKMYEQSDVFVLPSICMENFPLTILEAMRHGVPVVTTNIGGQAELVKPHLNGFLVNCKDSKELAKKILVILNDSILRKKLGESGREEVRKFNPKNHVERLERVYTLLRY